MITISKFWEYILMCRLIIIKITDNQILKIETYTFTFSFYLFFFNLLQCLLFCLWGLFVLLRRVNAVVYNDDWRRMLNGLPCQSLPYFLITHSFSEPESRLVSCEATPDFVVDPIKLFSGPFTCLPSTLTHWASWSSSCASSTC